MSFSNILATSQNQPRLKRDLWNLLGLVQPVQNIPTNSYQYVQNYPADDYNPPSSVFNPSYVNIYNVPDSYETPAIIPDSSYYLPPTNYAPAYEPPPEYQPPPAYEPPKVTFDDAPEIIYGISFRVRRKYACGEKDEVDCDKLEAEGNVVDCDIPRFK